MKKNYSIWLWLLALSCFIASCKKEKEDTLPAATQTGAGTFGCKINGKVYVPKGSSGTGAPNPKVQYDVDLNGKPYLFIETHQYSNSNTSVAGISLGFSNIGTIGLYEFPNNIFSISVGSDLILQNCGGSSFDNQTVALGAGQITNMNMQRRIISGIFSCKLKRQNCDTIFITEGRFDIKF